MMDWPTSVIEQLDKYVTIVELMWVPLIWRVVFFFVLTVFLSVIITIVAAFEQRAVLMTLTPDRLFIELSLAFVGAYRITEAVVITIGTIFSGFIVFSDYRDQFLVEIVYFGLCLGIMIWQNRPSQPDEPVAHFDGPVVAAHVAAPAA